MANPSRRDVLTAAGAVLALGLNPEGGGAQPLPGDMVIIPAGPARLGTDAAEMAVIARRYGFHPSWLAGEAPGRVVDVPAFAIDRYPVTNQEFARFCRATGYAPRDHWHGPEPPDEILRHPVVMVHRADAMAFAKWAGKRLPTQTEWEKAARGTDGRLFPWGNRFNPSACCWRRDVPEVKIGTMPVDAHPQGASPYGAHDMAGNVAEWVSDSPGPGSGILKGGCWMSASPLNLRAAANGMSGFDAYQAPFIGFRCVAEAK